MDGLRDGTPARGPRSEVTPARRTPDRPDRTTRRRHLTGGATAFLLAGTAACGPAPQPGASTSPGAASPATLDVILSDGESAWFDVWKPFEAARPNLTIRPSVLKWGEMMEKMLTLAAGGSLPDVTYIHPQFLPDFISAGVVRDLNGIIAKDKAVKPDDFFPGVLDFYRKQGTVYGLPFFSAPTMFFYNKIIFQRHGVKDPNEYEKEGAWTWSTFLEVSRQLTRGEGAEKTFGYQGTNSQLVWHAMWVWMNGGRLWDEAETTFLMHEPAAAEAVQFQADMVTRYRVQPNDQERQELPGGFLAGRTGLYPYGKGYAKAVAEAASMEAGICPVPKGKAGRITRDGPGAVGITGQSKQPEVAFELVKFMTGPGGQEPYLALGRSSPVRKSMANAREYLEALLPWEDKAIYEDASRSVHPMVYPAGFGEVERLWQQARGQIWSGTAASDALLAIKPAVENALRANRS